jgi:hypothetical protein
MNIAYTMHQAERRMSAAERREADVRRGQLALALTSLLRPDRRGRAAGRRRVGDLGMTAVLAGAATLAGAAVPAQAATPGWRQVFIHHYGAANGYSAFGAAVAASKSNAWVLGGRLPVSVAMSCAGTVRSGWWRST